MYKVDKINERPHSLHSRESQVGVRHRSSKKRRVPRTCTSKVCFPWPTSRPSVRLRWDFDPQSSDGNPSLLCKWNRPNQKVKTYSSPRLRRVERNRTLHKTSRTTVKTLRTLDLCIPSLTSRFRPWGLPRGARFRPARWEVPWRLL